MKAAKHKIISRHRARTPHEGFAVNAQIEREVRAHFHTASTVSNEHGGVDISFNRTLLLRTRTLGAAFVVAPLATAPAGSQEAAAPPLTRTNLTAAIGSDADARDIFSLLFAHVFQPGSPRQEFTAEGGVLESGVVSLGVRPAVPASESRQRGCFSTTSNVNDSGMTTPRPRPPAGAGPNVAATMKTRWLEGSRPMLRDAGLVCTVSAT
jgi:hypothetical protein